MDQNQSQTAPAIGELINKDITNKQWLTYYRNIWRRNCVAASLDVVTDTEAKLKNPEEMVACEDQEIRPVKARLEMRKEKLQTILNILKATETLIAIPEAEFEAKTWSTEALAVAEDMKPKPEETPAPTPTPETPVQAPVVETPEAARPAQQA